MDFDFQKYIEIITKYLSEYSLKIVAAILIFIVGKFIIKKLSAFIKNMMIKADIDLTLINFLHSVTYFTLLIVVVLMALSAVGINTTSFLAIFGAASLAIGLALKDSLSNIGAAVIIIIFRPYKIGEFITAAGATGTVTEINLFSISSR